MKAWLNARLPDWLEEDDWLTAHAKANIPDDLIEDKELLAEIRGDDVLYVGASRRGRILPLLEGEVDGRGTTMDILQNQTSRLGMNRPRGRGGRRDLERSVNFNRITVRDEAVLRRRALVVEARKAMETVSGDEK